MLGSKMMGVLTPSVPVEASRVVPLLFPLRADPIPQGECTSLEAELVRAMEADAGWTWLATALNPTGALWRRQQLFLRLATPTYAARLFESARGARVDSDVLLVLEQFSLVRASLCGLVGGPGKPSEWEAARRLRQLPPVGEFWNGRVPWDVVRALELAGHVDTSDVLVAHCVVDDGVANVSMAKELIHRDRFHTLALLVKHNPPEGCDRGLILEALMDRVPDRVDVSRVVFKDNATYEVIKEQCLAQKLEALAALWYQRDASRHLNWRLSLDFATSYIDHEDHAVRRRAFHASSNVCLQSVDAANDAIFERDLLRHVFTHLVRFRDIHRKTTSEQRETVALKHPLQCALHALVHVDKSRGLPFKLTVEPLLNAVIECLERRLFPSVHKLLITIASILALDLSNDKALRGRLQKAARSVSASILTESIAVLARAYDARTVLHFLCNIFIELKDVSPALEARTLSLCRNVSSRRSEQVWTSFPELCAHISGRLEDYRRDAKALDMGVSLTCVLLGVRPGCELLRVIVERVLCELEDEQYEPTDELLARVCFDAILSMASTVPASEFLVGDNAGGVVAEASDESSESDADSIRASEQQVYDLLNCRLEALFAVLHRQERVKQVGYSWPSAEEVDRAGYLELGGSNPSDEDDSADGDSADGDEPQRYQAQSGGLSFDEAVEELLSRAFPDGRPPGNMWLHVAPWDHACDLAYSGANVLDIPRIRSTDFSTERAVYFWPGFSSYQASRHDGFADARNINQVSRSMFVFTSRLTFPFKQFARSHDEKPEGNDEPEEDHARKARNSKRQDKAKQGRENKIHAEDRRGPSEFGCVVVLEPGLHQQHDLRWWHVREGRVNFDPNDFRGPQSVRFEGRIASPVAVVNDPPPSWECSPAASQELDFVACPTDATWLNVVMLCRRFQHCTQQKRGANEEDVRALRDASHFIFGPLAKRVNQGVPRYDFADGHDTNNLLSMQLAALKVEAVDYMRTHVVGVVKMRSK